MNTKMVKLYCAIGVGGMFGSVSRYGLSIAFQSKETLPYGTLVANLMGCFLLTFILHQDQIKRRLSPEIHAALSIGVIGSFTTLSTVMLETTVLWQTNRVMDFSYVFISVIGGLLLCYAGYKLATRKRMPI